MSFPDNLSRKSNQQWLPLKTFRRQWNLHWMEKMLGSLDLQMLLGMVMGIMTIQHKMVQALRPNVPVMSQHPLLICLMMISWSTRRTLSCKCSKNLLGTLFLFHFIFVKYCCSVAPQQTELLHFFLGQTRNARKACPNGVSLPEWILKSREIGIVFLSIFAYIITPGELLSFLQQCWSESLRKELRVSSWNNKTPIYAITFLLTVCIYFSFHFKAARDSYGFSRLLFFFPWSVQVVFHVN